MKLHEDKELFDTLIENIIEESKFNISSSIIEKDYYVTLVLKKIVEKEPDTIFKGGTSLSKCYKAIERFSEDIELTYVVNSNDVKARPSSREIKKFNEIVHDVITGLGFEIINEDKIKTRQRYNCFDVDYGCKILDGTGLKPTIKIETAMQVNSFPTETKEADTIIYQYLKDHSDDQKLQKIIGDYELEPFEVTVQALERTFIDKIFALCDYYLGDKVNGHSRHIYDLYMLQKSITFDDTLKELVSQVRTARQQFVHCLSVRNGKDINIILQEIVDKKVYESDYSALTLKLLYKELPYNDAISVLTEITDSGIMK